MASDGVDVSGWTWFTGEEGEYTPFLVGPIVGAVGDETARVVVEVSEDMTVTMEAFIDDESVCFVEQELTARTPTAFALDGLTTRKRVFVTVLAGEQERQAQFTTTTSKQQWKIATVSCNCHTHSEKLGLWNRLSSVIGEVDCVVHLGDQIYGDSDFGTRESGEPFLSAWHESLSVLEPLPSEEWPDHEEEILEFYRNTYRTTWNIKHVAKVLASTANYMICDDHEFTDDLGDEPSHSNPSTVEFHVACLAYRVYNEYQRQLLSDIEDVADMSLKPYYATKIGPKIGLFMTENRVERSLHRDQATKADWENQSFLGPAQWNRLTDAFENDFAECDIVLFGAPTPLVFLSQKATWLAQSQIDDARGTWGHTDFEAEQKAVCELLSNWQNAQENRAVISLGGDVHMGGFTDSWHNGSKIPLHQMTASAVGNMPEGNLTATKKMVVRTAITADAKFFKFKVCHYEWIIGPNYGMIDLFMRKKVARPDITLTLIPHEGKPKIRNLQLGDRDVDIKNADHSRPSKAAHHAGKFMGAAPTMSEDEEEEEEEG